MYDFYIAGPMTGYPEHNFPAFHEAEENLALMGHSCFNPANNFDGDTSLPWEAYMRADIKALSKCKGIYLLEGWRKSRGACFEYLIAKTLNMNIVFEESRGDTEPVGENDRIALCGYSRVGKDEVGKWFIQCGYERKAVGDIIKSQVDPVVQAHLGHSAFTEDDEKKENIREFLVHHGYANYDNILDEYFDSLQGKVVNTRLYRYKEAVRWIEEGGKIILIERPGFDAREPKAEEELNKIKSAGLIDEVIVNDGSILELYGKLGRKFPNIASREVSVWLGHS